MSKENEIVVIDPKRNDKLPEYGLGSTFQDICVQVSNAKTTEIKPKKREKVVKKSK